ncbi:MAG: hypothetical protein AAF267_19880, partial [Deinococcota bacterium]
MALAWQPKPEVVITTQHNDLHATLFTTGELVIVDDLHKQRLRTEVYGESVEFWRNLPMLLQFDDLDDDETLELIVIVSTPGVSCCSTLAVAYMQNGQYMLTDALYRKYGISFELQDVDVDGWLEIRTLNTPFNALLGGSDAVAIASPLQILAFQQGKLTDISHDFPELVRAQLADWQTELATAQPEEPCEVLAAGTYLALRYLLNEGEQGWRELARFCPLDGATRTRLRQALVEFNYAEGFTRIDPDDVDDLTTPLDWSLELIQHGQTLIPVDSSVSLLADTFTVNITLPRPHPVYLNLSAGSTNYQQLVIGEDVTSRDNELFSLATGIAEL